MCGEHWNIAVNRLFDRGSSPHVRGAQQGGRLNHSRNGIIPACAGSTIYAHNPWFPVRDHPRMCGEHCGRFVGSVLG